MGNIFRTACCSIDRIAVYFTHTWKYWAFYVDKKNENEEEKNGKTIYRIYIYIFIMKYLKIFHLSYDDKMRKRKILCSSMANDGLKVFGAGKSVDYSFAN